MAVGFLKTTFSVLGLVASGYVGVSSAMASSLTRTTRVRSEETPESVGLDYQEVSFASRGGDALLTGWLIPAKSVAKSQITDAQGGSWIVMVNGDNTNRSDPTTGMLLIAKELNEDGFGILMFDLRGRGDSPSEISSSGYFERLDLQGASDHLVSNGVDRDRIGVLGFSLGGAVALLAGANPNNFGAVISDSAFADLSLVLRDRMTGVKRPLAMFFPGMKLMAKTIYGIDIDDVSPARAIARSDTPVLIIHGQEDKMIPVEHARLLGRAIGASFDEIEGSVETVWIVPGAGHTQAFSTQPRAYINLVANFFKSKLMSPTP